MSAGVVEIVRDGLRETARIRHQRTKGDSWWVGIACSPGEGIVAPFDDESMTSCPECWRDEEATS